MKTNIIKEIWEISGDIDKAIANQDIVMYNKAHKRFMKLFENQEVIDQILNRSLRMDQVYDSFGKLLSYQYQSFL